jgi:hypothetical protein
MLKAQILVQLVLLQHFVCHLGPFVEWDKQTINNILNTGYEIYKKSVNNTEVIAKEKQIENPQVSFQFVELGGFFRYVQSD